MPPRQGAARSEPPAAASVIGQTFLAMVTVREFLDHDGNVGSAEGCRT